MDNSNKDPDALVQEATAWFKNQTSHYEVISAEPAGDRVVVLTGTKNPGTDTYQLLQAFIVGKAGDGFAVNAWKDGESAVSAGFSAHALVADGLTVVFGDTQDSVFDFSNDQRIDAAFTEARVLLSDGKSETKPLTGNAPYLLVLDGEQTVQDVEFSGGGQTVVCSDLYGDGWAADAATLNTEGLFE